MKRNRSQDPVREQAQGIELAALTDRAVEQALQLAPEVATAPSVESSERALDVAFRSLGDAVYARKRVNEALTVAEWDRDISAWVWDRERHQRPPLTEQGAALGWELRLELRQAP